MAFDVKAEILSAIGKTDDNNIKAVLLLLFGVLEELGGKIDSMMGSEVRRAVLNGHEEVHHEHHEWITARMASDCAEVCAWAKDKMEDEKDAEAQAKIDARANRRVAIEEGIRKVVTLVIGAAIGATSLLWALK